MCLSELQPFKKPKFPFYRYFALRARATIFIPQHETPSKSTIFVSFEECLSLLSFGDGGRVHSGSGGGDIFQCLAPVAFQESGTLRKC